MNNNEIAAKVESHYLDNIYPKCPNFEECKGNVEKFPKSPKMSYIGKEYGNNPKLLFLSLDSGDTENKYSTINEIRDLEEKRDFNSTIGKEKGKHWFQTFNLAVHILKPFLKDLIQNENDVKPYIVHANSAKCNQGKKGRKQADNILFKNCKDFVVAELPLYEPNIIVTQGNKAWDVLNRFTVNDSESFPIKCNYKSKEVKMNVYVRDMNGKKVMHIPMYHSSYYKGYWGQKECLIHNIDEITEKLAKYSNSIKEII